MRRRRIARFATLNSHHRRGDEEDTRNAKATDAIQVEQTYTARWGVGPNDYIRFRAGAFGVHPHMLRHACGYKLANEGHDTRSLAHYLGHRNLQSTARYTALAPDRFAKFWTD
jgi:integrase